MHIGTLKEELRVASVALQELELFQNGLLATSHTSWHQSRCNGCGQLAFVTLHYHLHRYRSEKTAAELLAYSSFEILDGYCIECGNDSLWPRLCRFDPTRDPALGEHQPCGHMDYRCPVCDCIAFNGIQRGSIWSGACNDCHVLYASRRVKRDVRKNLANVSRARRELRSSIRRLTVQINGCSQEHLAEFLDDDDVITLPPSS